MRLTEFFDLDNLEHLQAYQKFCQIGAWPQSFLSQMETAGVDLRAAMLDAVVDIANRLAARYVAEHLASLKK